MREKPGSKINFIVEDKFFSHTFINAFESSPVHCSKFRPSLNLRSPGKLGTAAILEGKFNIFASFNTWIDVPTVNIFRDFFCPTLAILKKEIFINPGNNMVLERAFDNLVKKVGREQFMNVGPREFICEWLEIFGQHWI